MVKHSTLSLFAEAAIEFKVLLRKADLKFKHLPAQVFFCVHQ